MGNHEKHRNGKSNWRRCCTIAVLTLLLSDVSAVWRRFGLHRSAAIPVTRRQSKPLPGVFLGRTELGRRHSMGCRWQPYETYDVLLFAVSDPGINATGRFHISFNLSRIRQWTCRQVGSGFDVGGGSLPVPGLTDGIANSFVNNHISSTLGGQAGPRIRPFSAQRQPGSSPHRPDRAGSALSRFPGAGGAAGNQYKFLLNELRWVTSGVCTTSDQCSMATAPQRR